MSRAKAKIAILHDMQSRYSDVILTKKDCDMIKKALLETYKWKEISMMLMWEEPIYPYLYSG